jgi:hypothetical protein
VCLVNHDLIGARYAQSRSSGVAFAEVVLRAQRSRRIPPSGHLHRPADDPTFVLVSFGGFPLHAESSCRSEKQAREKPVQSAALNPAKHDDQVLHGIDPDQVGPGTKGIEGGGGEIRLRFGCPI